jgi:hypothetical protein
MIRQFAPRKKPRLGAGVAYLYAHREGWRACRTDSVHDRERDLCVL